MRYCVKNCHITKIYNFYGLKFFYLIIFIFEEYSTLFAVFLNNHIFPQKLSICFNFITNETIISTGDAFEIIRQYRNKIYVIILYYELNVNT